MSGSQSLIQAHGGYRNLKSFQVAQLVYDLTTRFCDGFVDRRSRTHDQMVQAARSGTQNIVEGSMVSATSKKLELKLTGVARASLEELRIDYEDYLRQRGLKQWAPDDPRRQALVDRRCQSADEVAKWVREICAAQSSGQSGRRGPERAHAASTASTLSSRHCHAETAANAALVLINVASTLLGRQLEALAASFEAEGGFTERLYRIRRQRRAGQ